MNELYAVFTERDSSEVYKFSNLTEAKDYAESLAKSDPSWNVYLAEVKMTVIAEEQITHNIVWKKNDKNDLQ